MPKKKAKTPPGKIEMPTPEALEASTPNGTMKFVRKKKVIEHHFAERLKALRKDSGLTQVELAERAGLFQPQIAAMERGENEPVWSTVLRLAEALGCATLDYFLDDQDLPTRRRKKNSE